MVPMGVTLPMFLNPHRRAFAAAEALPSWMPMPAKMSVVPLRVAAPTKVRPAFEV